MIQRPPGMGAFQFVVLSTLRAAQLIRGCRPRVDGGHKAIITAQFEVAEGKVTPLSDEPVVVGDPTGESHAPAENIPILLHQT
jgi:DNA-directed RNA polymerase subunit K/omega